MEVSARIESIPDRIIARVYQRGQEKDQSAFTSYPLSHPLLISRPCILVFCLSPPLSITPPDTIPCILHMAVTASIRSSLLVIGCSFFKGHRDVRVSGSLIVRRRELLISRDPAFRSTTEETKGKKLNTIQQSNILMLRLVHEIQVSGQDARNNSDWPWTWIYFRPSIPWDLKLPGDICFCVVEDPAELYLPTFDTRHQVRISLSTIQGFYGLLVRRDVLGRILSCFDEKALARCTHDFFRPGGLHYMIDFLNPTDETLVLGKRHPSKPSNLVTFSKLY